MARMLPPMKRTPLVLRDPSPALTVDDTGARHEGEMGSTLALSGPFFAAFKTTDSKSRTNFLGVLHGGDLTYRLNETAGTQAATWGLSAQKVIKLRAALGATSYDEVLDTLKRVGIAGAGDRQVVLDGALAGGLH